VSYFFAFETVLSSRYKLDILEKAKSEGYFIKCIFMLTTDASVKFIPHLRGRGILAENS